MSELSTTTPASENKGSQYTVVLLLLFSFCIVGLVLYLVTDAKSLVTSKLKSTDYSTIGWEDLLHPEDLYARLNPPIWFRIMNGTFQEQADESAEPQAEPVTMDRYEEALASTRINPELNGQAVSIPAYIVPLEFTDDMYITEFFMVPFYGACLHLPPPPPNQLIHVTYPKGHKFESQSQELLESNDQAVMVSGILKTLEMENDIAPASYTMQVQRLEAYTKDP